MLHMPKFENKLLKDIAANIIGFIPIGFMFPFGFRRVTRKSLCLSSLLGFSTGVALSLFVEVVQVWLPSRDSSFLDLAMNAVGAAIGTIAFIGLIR